MIQHQRRPAQDQQDQTDQRVAISITASDNPISSAFIRGKVVNNTTDGAGDHKDSLDNKYLGVDAYPTVNPARCG